MSSSPPPNSVTLHIGQAVAWPSAPMGVAQIAELRTRRVRICYPCKNGRIRQPVVAIATILRQPLLFQLSNPFDRAIVKGSSRTYTLNGHGNGAGSGHAKGGVS